MMNRKDRRRVDKSLKQKLTNEQYKDFTQKTFLQAVDQEAKRRFALFIENFISVMKKNRISEERINKILDEFEEVIKSGGIQR